MRFALLAAMLLLVQCAPKPITWYDGRYSGVMYENACFPNSFISANVYNASFDLAVGHYRITGKLFDDGKLEGRDLGNNVTFKGSIAGPFFGRLFSGKITDGKCNPYVELSPQKSKLSSS